MKVKSRFTAFFIHLFLSFLVLVALIAVLFFIWYPNDLIFAGGFEGLKILLAVDLVLGPLLTLIVYKHGKKSLKFDLSAIAVLQISCLIIGVWLIYTQRPVIQTLSDDGVHIISAADAKEHNIDLSEFTGETPKLIFSEIPEGGVKERFGFKFTTELNSSIPFTSNSNYYKEMSEISDEQYIKRLDDIKETVGASKVSENPSMDCTWIPIKSNHSQGQACFNKEYGVITLSNKKIF